MYQPAHFRIEDDAVLHEFVRAHPLGLLVTVVDGEAMVDAIPFLLDTVAGPKGVLKAHVARTNPHWRALAPAARCLVVFQATGHYISPSWYPSKQLHGRAVPTWNYVKVDVRGRAIVREDKPWLAQHVRELTDMHEGERPGRWRTSDAPGDFIAAQLRAIVGIEIEIEEMNGKFKLSQNRPEEDRKAVCAALGQEGSAGELAAGLMRARGIGV